MKYKNATITVSGKCYGTTEKRELVFLWGEGEYWRLKVMCELDLKEGTGVYKL